MRVPIALIAIFLASCTTDARLAREADDACSGDNQNCSPQLASRASLRTLRNSGDYLVVSCEMTFKPVDDTYRETCQRQLFELASQLSAKWQGTIAPINAADISQSEYGGCIETLDRDIDFYGIKGNIPLRWLSD